YTTFHEHPSPHLCWWTGPLTSRLSRNSTIMSRPRRRRIPMARVSGPARPGSMPSAFRWPSASASSARQLAAGTIVSLRHIPDGEGPRERIGIRRDDDCVVYICWSKRILVLRQELEADGWLRRQLALLGACWCAAGVSAFAPCARATASRFI